MIILPSSFLSKNLLVRPVVSTSKDSGTIPGHFKPGALQHGIACKRTGPQLHLSLSLSLLLAHSFHLHPTSFLSFAPPHPVSLLFLLPLTASVRCGCHAGDNHRQGGGKRGGREFETSVLSWTLGRGGGVCVCARTERRRAREIQGWKKKRIQG
ncbi:hypothetical protein NPIL_635781 [Nephila pilipes]|uniref:Uncharacterized protein n=1 Tax=Nephila pilipes TaxID=299642 RepID=A0A8X6MIN0_NEPPI|nr:hypothetical protein NPIL_635781 [Nephila pilipes]